MVRGGVIISVIVLVLIGAAVYLTFFYASSCDNQKCWEENLKECSSAKYQYSPRDVDWLYTIKGKSGNSCEVKVEVIKIKQGLEKTKTFEGKSMNCYLELNDDGDTILVAPEKDINLCTGRLKEEMQTMIIERLYEYIVGNVGQIGEELTEAPIGNGAEEVETTINNSATETTNST